MENIPGIRHCLSPATHNHRVETIPTSITVAQHHYNHSCQLRTQLQLLLPHLRLEMPPLVGLSFLSRAVV